MPPNALIHKLAPFQPLLAIRDGSQVALSFGSAPASVESEYWALRREAGLLDLSHRGRVLLRGKDAARFLHGMVTNDVQGLRPGAGQYAFLLNVHGHILADAHVFRLDEQSFLVDCQTLSHDVVWQALEHHIIMDDVALEDLREQFCLFAVEGPMARRALEGAFAGDLPPSNAFAHIYREDLAARLVHASLSGEDGFWVLTEPRRAAELLDAILTQKVIGNEEFAVRPVGFEALEVCRIEAGIPRYGIDITEKNLPQETGQMYAISFNKGCYVGQEVVERIRSQGHVNRRLVRLLLDGRQEIAPETPIVADGQTVGSTRSSRYSFGLEKTVALGYLRREHAEAGKRVMIGTSCRADCSCCMRWLIPRENVGNSGLQQTPRDSPLGQP